MLFEPVRNFEYYGGSGGTTAYVASTSVGTLSDFIGHAGVLDTFAIGFAGDMNKILGAIRAYGHSADNDFAYYYEYLNPNPHTYTISTYPFLATMVFERAGIASVQFGGLAQVVFYTPSVGGNTVNVQGVIAPTFLNMGVGNGDNVTIGSNAPNLNGTLAEILGPISVGGYAQPDGSLADVNLMVDNSANLATGYQGVSLIRKQGPLDYGHQIFNFGPTSIYWNLSDESTVDLRGGAADEFFTVANGLDAAISIDGGAGHALLQSEGGVPATFVFTGHNAGTLYDNVRFSSIRSFYGTDADDTFVFGYGGSIDGGIDGFGGDNTIDHSAGLATWWKGENNTLDAVGGQHGTAVNVNYATGKVGQAFEFNMQFNQYIEIDNASILEPETVTVEAWVNSLNAPSGRYILAKGAKQGVESAYGLSTGLDLNQPGGLVFTLSSSPSPIVSPNAGPGIWDGNWHHVVGTYDGTAIRLYVDGVEVGIGTPYSEPIAYGGDYNSHIYIGAFDAALNYASFLGKIDEVGIFNRALNLTEIQQIFNAGSEGKAKLSEGVTVNLRNNTSTGAAGGVFHIQNVIGSAGNDILVGNGGNVLTGGAGRDLLIAGLTASQLFGGDGEDILIAGTTVHDQNEGNLNAIRDIWTSDADYNTRVQALRTGLLNDDAGAVSSNGQQNTLFGQGGTDLFFLSGLDQHDAIEEEEFVGI